MIAKAMASRTLLVAQAVASRAALAARRLTHTATSSPSSPSALSASASSAAASAAASAASEASDGQQQRAKRTNLYSLSESELRSLLEGWGEPPFRAAQLRAWMYKKSVSSFNGLKDIPLALRERLNSEFSLGEMEVAKELVSKDGTRKRAYRLADGHIIESVLMPYKDNRYTACISSQVGCGMGCVFCATGQMGFKRQLSATEIFEQVQRFNVLLKPEGKRVTNVVFMGMGEPFANYKNVMEAVERINRELGIAARRITISTSGIVPRIRQLADSHLQVGLAISLHAATDEGRAQLMPVNDRYPLSELMAACRYYTARTNRRITFEWALIQGKTDRPQEVHALGRLLQPLLCHVNVIPLNPTAGYKGLPSQRGAVQQFIDILARYGVPATPRVRRGIDIEAGCGQLTEKVIQEQEQESAARQEARRKRHSENATKRT